MKHAVCFTSDNGNRYIYSPYRHQIRLIHPLILFFYQLERSGTSLTQWVDALNPNEEISVEGAGLFTPEEIRYQKRKYLFLKKHGFLKPAKPANLSGRLSVPDVKKNIATVKQIIFEVTEDCNLHCTYCTYSKFYINQERKKRCLAFDDVRHTLDTLIQQRTPSPFNQLIISFYGGEPLKNFRFIESVVAYAQSFPPEQISFRYTMSSNGLLLKKYIRFLVEHNMELSISLDGDEEANAFRITGNQKPSFELVTGNLDYVKHHYPVYFDKNINFLTVLHRRNSHLSVFRFFKERYGKTPMMSEVNPVNLTPEHAREFRETIQQKPVCQSEEANSIRSMTTHHPKVREMTDLVQHYSGFVFKDPLELISTGRSRRKSRKRLPTATCMPFSIRAYFNASGYVIPCEHISTIHTIGSYSADQLNLDPQAITRLYNAYYDKITRLCNTCYFADNCQDCMFNAGIEKDHPSCAFYTGEAGFAAHLKRGFSRIEDDFRFFLTIAQKFFHEE